MGQSQELKAALARLLASTATDEDRSLLHSAFLSETLVTGQRAVAIGGNASDVIITTGDHNVVLSFKDADKETIQSILTSLASAAFENGRSEDELLKAYRDHLLERINKIYILGELESRSLDRVFVELDVVEEYRRPLLHDEYMGLMDIEMRRRRRIFDPISDDDKKDSTRSTSKRTIRPEELLRTGTRAIITGAPGCGKSTLLRFLASHIVSEGQGFPVFLEFKSISNESLKSARNDMCALLFDEALARPLMLEGPERERFRRLFFARVALGTVAIFLDGLDEISGTDFFARLCTSVSDLSTHTHHNNTIIVSTRPYALHKTRLIGFKEMEIAPLKENQVEAFLRHYYSDAPGADQLLKSYRQKRPLRELMHVPFLLILIVYLHRNQGSLRENRLQLYRQLVLQLAVQLDREKQLEHPTFQITDPDGTLKLDFLKFVAFERLFVDKVRDTATSEEVSRTVFTGEILVQKAKQFVQKHNLHSISPYVLAADVKATPLLREIGADIFAFAHLIIQEYLAAIELSERPGSENWFYRGVFRAVAEMEVLPMALGFAQDPNTFYEMLEHMPESLTLTNFRLRARSLSYVDGLSSFHVDKLATRLCEFITGQISRSSMPQTTERDFSSALVIALRGHESAADDFNVQSLSESIIRSFSESQVDYLSSIVHHIVDLFNTNQPFSRRRTAEALGLLGAESAVNILLKALRDDEKDVRYAAAKSLGQINAQSAVPILLERLSSTTSEERQSVVEALGFMREKKAVPELIKILNQVGTEEKEIRAVGSALGEIGADLSVPALLEALKDPRHVVREAAVSALGRVGSARAVHSLAEALNDPEMTVREKAAGALGEIGGEDATNALSAVIFDGLYYSACTALKKIGTYDAFSLLIDGLSSPVVEIRRSAAGGLRIMDHRQAVLPFIKALTDVDDKVREYAAEALGSIGNDSATVPLINALNDRHSFVRRHAAQSLGRLKAATAIPALIDALNDPDSFVTYYAAIALGQIGDNSCVPHLRALFSRDEYWIRKAALRGLRELTHQDALEFLLSVMADPSDVVRANVVRNLRELGTPAVVAPLVRMLKDPAPMPRQLAVEALVLLNRDHFVRGLQIAFGDYSEDVRLTAAGMIGYYVEDAELIKPLSSLAETGLSAEVRCAASDAISSLNLKLKLLGDGP